MVKYIILFSLFYTGCVSREIKNNNELQRSKDDIIQNQDIISYIKLTNLYNRDSNYLDILPYSLLMLKEENVGYSDFIETYLRLSF